MGKVTKDQIASVTIRMWTPDDLQGTWKVLREACFSLLLPAFTIYTSKKSFQYFTVAVAALTYAWTKSSICFLLAIILCYIGVYILQLTGLLIYLYIPTSVSIRDLHSVQNMQEAYFTRDTTGFWVAEVRRTNGCIEIAGTIAIATIPSDRKKITDHDCVWLRRMAVLKKYRSLGIAKQLIETTIGFCREKNVRKVELYSTEVHQAARKLYAKLGFKLMPTECKRHIVFRTISMPEYMLEYDLTA